MYVVMYHYVRDLANSRYPKIKGMDIQKFREQIVYFKKKFTIITMEDAIAAWNDDAKLPENALLLTFDDGYADHYQNVFPILHEEKIQGSFFIPACTFAEDILLDVNKIHFILASADIRLLVKDVKEEIEKNREKDDRIPSVDILYKKYANVFRYDDKDTIFVKRMLQTALPYDVRKKISSNLFKKYVGMNENVFAKELYMRREQIQMMKDNGMHIGIHGYNHFWLANLSTDDMKKDIMKAVKAMEGLIDRKNWVMCYPYGSYNDEVLDLIEKEGCKLAFSTVESDAKLSKYTRFELPRLDCNDFYPKSNDYIKYLC